MREATGKGEHGCFSSWDKRIDVCVGVHLSDVVETLLHEIAHAINMYSGLLDGDLDNERVAATYGLALAQVYRDNPELAKWLWEAGKAMAAE